MEQEKIFCNLADFKLLGLGPKTLTLFNALGINTLFDLFYDFPKYYEDRTNFKNIDDLVEDELVTVKGKVLKTNILVTKYKKKIFKAYIFDGKSVLEAVWFQMPYLVNVIKKDIEINVTGKAVKNIRFQMINPDYSFNDVEKEILPIYGLGEGLRQSIRRAIIKKNLHLVDFFNEIIPEEIVKKYKIMDRKEALKEIHFPSNNHLKEQAVLRFSIEELILLQLMLLKNKFTLDHLPRQKYVLTDNKEFVTKYLKSLNFQLTNAQKRVIAEIYREINDGKIVNRLIQGDVGSGKSIVAFVLMLYIVSNGFQCALMVPTEILADQHYIFLKEDFKNLGINVAVISSSKSEKEKKEILEMLKSGKIDILIGTHSLIYDRVIFNKLGLIVIDEQHKFGVQQRKLLSDKSQISNLIAMSATPIPRSLALTFYGDLDVSIIDELPPGRKVVETKVVKQKDLNKFWESLKARLNQEEQCYIVTPLVEDSEKLSAASAEAIYSDLKDNIFKEYRVGLLHGKMKSDEKEKIINQFKKNEIQILVSTTVIEVGVNVPNASIMVILNAERFGLSQLHQLRGRVGRGNKQSSCFLVNALSGVSERLDIMSSTNDGFKIAEEDLRIRKAGEILGTKQSGISGLKFFDLLRDIKTIQLARDEVIKYLKENKGEISDILKLEMKKRFEEQIVFN